MISRRDMILAGLASGAAAGLPGPTFAATTPAAPAWRRVQVTTRIDLADETGAAQAWIPLGGFEDADWVRAQGNTWTASRTAHAETVTSGGAALLHVRWDGTGPRTAEVTSTFLTRDRASSLAGQGTGVHLSGVERARYLAGSAAAPTDGIVKDLSDRITAGKTTDVEKVRAIYEWVVLHTFRSAATQGCGDGNIVRMLRSGELGGKCDDINPLFVALVRAAGVPARDLYGIRVAPSRLGYASLGPATPAVTKAQHCRADVFLDGVGWTAMDPADVRKVMLEEKPGDLDIDDPRVRAARARLFGSWEGNWVPFNAANDVALPGRAGAPLNFLMYPQVAHGTELLDCYGPTKIRYEITAKELAI